MFRIRKRVAKEIIAENLMFMFVNIFDTVEHVFVWLHILTSLSLTLIIQKGTIIHY